MEILNYSKVSNYIKRDKCVVTGKEDLEPLYLLIDFPIFIGCTEQDQVDIIMRNEVFFSHSHVLEHFLCYRSPNLI
mgnify:CR=1 FL=1